MFRVLSSPAPLFVPFIASVFCVLTLVICVMCYPAPLFVPFIASVFCVMCSPAPLFVPFIASDTSSQCWQSGLIRRCESFSLLRNDYIRLVNHSGFIHCCVCDEKSNFINFLDSCVSQYCSCSLSIKLAWAILQLHQYIQIFIY